MDEDPFLERSHGHDLRIGLSVFEPPEQMLEPLRQILGQMLDDSDPDTWGELPQLGPLTEDDPGARAWAEVTFWREIVARRPDRPGAQLRVAEALVEVGKLPAASAALLLAHRQDPSGLGVAELIVKLHQVHGRDWRDFDWVENPPVVSANPQACDLAWERILEKGGVDMNWLYMELFDERIPLFGRTEFTVLLADDGRFDVRGGWVEARAS